MPRDHDGDFQGSFFALEIKGVELALFTACSGLSVEFNEVTFKQNDGTKTIETKRPGGKITYSQVVLKRGFSADQAVYTWFNEIAAAADKTTYKEASIVVYDRIQKEVARFNLENCWPSNLKVSDLSTSSDEVMVEELTLEHEFIDWV